MPRYLDLEQWPRRAHFEFFRHYDSPFFGVCAPLEVSALRRATRGPDSPSFFLSALHSSLVAANEIEPFRYRLRGDRVLVHDVVHGGSTVLRDDETFGFAYFDYTPDPEEFAAATGPVLEEARRGSGSLEARSNEDGVIHYSVLPWISFTGFTHARRRDPDDSIPKIVFGRAAESPAVPGRYEMPVSVELHHSLADGLDVARFFERYQELLSEPG